MKKLQTNTEKEDISHTRTYIGFHCLHLRFIDCMFPFSAKNLKLVFNYCIGCSPFGLHGQVYRPINNQIRLKDALYQLSSTAKSCYVLLICIFLRKICQNRLGYQELNQSKLWKKLSHLQFPYLGIKIDRKNKQICFKKMSQQCKLYHNQKIKEILQQQLRKTKQQQSLLEQVLTNIRQFFSEFIRQSYQALPKIPNLNKILIQVQKQASFINFQRIQHPQLKAYQQFYLSLKNYNITSNKQFEQVYNSLLPINYFNQQLLQTCPREGNVNMSNCDMNRKDLRLILQNSQGLVYVLIRQKSQE